MHVQPAWSLDTELQLNQHVCLPPDSGEEWPLAYIVASTADTSPATVVITLSLDLSDDADSRYATTHIHLHQLQQLASATSAEILTAHSVPCSLRMVPPTPAASMVAGTRRSQSACHSAECLTGRKRSVEMAAQQGAGAAAVDRCSGGCPPGPAAKTQDWWIRV
jgi:hypothetical protein